MRLSRLLRCAGLVMLLGGIPLAVLAALEGQMEVALFIMFPVIYGGGWIAGLAILLIFLGSVLFFFSLLPVGLSPSRAEREESYCLEREKGLKAGGVVLIGPIPIVFGSDWKMAGWAILLAIALVIIFWVLLF